MLLCTRVQTRQGPLGFPHTLQGEPEQLLSPKPAAALAAGLARPDQLGLDTGAQDADRRVPMHQVGAELAEPGVERLDLAGKRGVGGGTAPKGRFVAMTFP